MAEGYVLWVKHSYRGEEYKDEAKTEDENKEGERGEEKELEKRKRS